MLNNLKSPTAWASLASLVIMVFKHYGIFRKLGISVNEFNAFLDCLMTTLVAFGIFSNTNKK